MIEECILIPNLPVISSEKQIEERRARSAFDLSSGLAYYLHDILYETLLIIF